MSAAEFEVMGRIAQSIASIAEEKLRHVVLTDAEWCEILNALNSARNIALWRKLCEADSFSYTDPRAEAL